MHAVVLALAAMAYMGTGASLLEDEQAMQSQGRALEGRVDAQLHQENAGQLLDQARQRKFESVVEKQVKRREPRIDGSVAADALPFKVDIAEMEAAIKKAALDSVAADALPFKIDIAEMEAAMKKASLDCAAKQAAGLVRSDCRTKP